MKTIIISICALLAWANCTAQAQFRSINDTPLPPLDQTAQPGDYSPIGDGKCHIRMSHSTDGVFVQVVIPDKGLQAKFMTQGLTLYIDPAGSKSKKYSVVFPVADMKTMRNSMPSYMNGGRQGQGGQNAQGGQPNRNSQPNARPERGTEMNLKPVVDNMAFQPSHFMTGKKESTLGSNNVSITYTSEGLVYTCIIPYSNLGGKVAKKGLVGIGLLSKTATSSTQGNSEMQRPEGAPQGMGGGRLGGGMGGGMSGGGMSGGMPGGGGGMGGRGGGMPPSGSGSDMRPQMNGQSSSQSTYQEWMTFTLN